MPANRNIDDKKARIYAQAVFDSAQGDRDMLVEYFDEFRTVFNEYKQENRLSRIFGEKLATPEKRAEMAEAAFAPFAPGIREVLVVMAARGDFDLINFVVEDYKYMAEDALDAVLVTVVTAVELDDHLREVITDKLRKDFNRDVIIREFVDKSIVGGIIMSAHGRRIDASIATQLEKARAALAATPVGGER